MPKKKGLTEGTESGGFSSTDYENRKTLLENQTLTNAWQYSNHMILPDGHDMIRIYIRYDPNTNDTGLMIVPLFGFKDDEDHYYGRYSAYPDSATPGTQRITLQKSAGDRDATTTSTRVYADMEVDPGCNYFRIAYKDWTNSAGLARGDVWVYALSWESSGD